MIMGFLVMSLYTHWKQQETSAIPLHVSSRYKQEHIAFQKVERCSISEIFQNIHYY